MCHIKQPDNGNSDDNTLIRYVIKIEPIFVFVKEPEISVISQISRKIISEMLMREHETETFWNCILIAQMRNVVVCECHSFSCSNDWR